jgi:hypothetical protein
MKTLECNCSGYCIEKLCRSSDSGLLIKACWCVECKEYRKELKARAKSSRA